MIVFQGHRSVRQIQLLVKILCSYEVETVYDCWLHQVGNEYTTFFFFLHMFKRDNWNLSLFEKTLLLPFSWTLLKVELSNFACL